MSKTDVSKGNQFGTGKLHGTLHQRVRRPPVLRKALNAVSGHCLAQTHVLLLALSLSRDAGGVVFEIVVHDRHVDSAIKFSVASPYVGNLLTGNLAGESAETLQAYIRGLKRDPMNSFLVGLFKEARQERSPDFQYVRFWQILETMADNCNYDPSAALHDYEGTESREVCLQRWLRSRFRPRKYQGDADPRQRPVPLHG